LVEAPAPSHKFFNRANLALLGLSALNMVADVSTTRRALQTPGTRELNPLAQSSTQLDVLKFAGMGAGLGIAYMLHHQGHCRAERFVPVLVALPSAGAAVHSATLPR
jgi:glucokinase